MNKPSWSSTTPRLGPQVTAGLGKTSPNSDPLRRQQDEPLLRESVFRSRGPGGWPRKGLSLNQRSQNVLE
jgi:hypothetical protein